MLVGGYKPDQAWKTRSYPVPTPSRSGFRWKASALRSLHRWNGEVVSERPATIMVPALFTFHTLHNADHFFDSTIGAVRDTWVKEGNLSPDILRETRRQFGKPYDYH